MFLLFNFMDYACSNAGPDPPLMKVNLASLLGAPSRTKFPYPTMKSKFIY